MNLGIIDYGAGNLRSVLNAFEFVGQKAKVIKDSDELCKFDKVVLPGVGAFGQAMEKLKSRNFDTAIKEFVQEKKPFLGICLGMQLLFEKGYEFGTHTGLGLLKGEVVAFDKSKIVENLKIPHIGWNSIEFLRQTAINKELKNSEYLYFVHSFHAVCDENIVLGVSDYGYKFVSAVAFENLFGFQPHPEKSHSVGLRILKNFVEL